MGGREAIIGNTKIHTEFSWVRQRYPITCLDRKLGLHDVQAPRIPRRLAFQDGKIFSPPHQPSLTPLPPRGTSGTHFCYSLSQTQGHSAAGPFKSMKYINDPIENRNLVLPFLGGN